MSGRNMTEQLSLDALLGEDAVLARSLSPRRRRPLGSGPTAAGAPVDQPARLMPARGGRGGEREAAPRSAAAPGQERLQISGRSLSGLAIADLLGRPAPTPEQVAVIEAPVEPLLVVAGAGSGKTETMAGRVVWLVANGHVEPEQVLGLTFTRKAAGELAERIRSRLRALYRRGAIPEPGPVAVSTYHAYAASVLADHGLRLGVEPASRLLGEAAAWQLVDEIVERWDGDMSDVESARSTVVERVLSLAGECAEHLVDPDHVDVVLERMLSLSQRLPGFVGAGVPGAPDAPGVPGAPRPAVREVLQKISARRRLLPLVRAFARRKRESELLDFGDQVALAARIAREVPQVGKAERERFPVVLLDEYQDTSHAQLVLLKELFGEGHPVTAVGDPNQSIYGWRGASAGTLQRFCEEFPTAGGDPARALHLSTSWRNEAAVLAVANAVAADLRTPPPWQAPGRHVEVQPLRARPGAGGGEVEVQWHATVEQEVAGVAEAVEAAWRGLSQPGAEAPPSAGSHPSVAVLCRTRSQFPMIEAALRGRGLPVEVVGLGGLLHVPEVADLRAALEVVRDPSRGDSLTRLLTGGAWRLGAGDLAGLGAWAATLARRPGGAPAGPSRPAVDPEVAEERSIVEALDRLPDPQWEGASGERVSAAGLGRLSRLADVLRGLRTRSASTLVDLVVEVERALLLDVEVAALPGRSAALARAHLDAFVEVAAAFSAGRRAGLGAFLGWLDAAEKAERGLDAPLSERADDAVQVLTVHAAKGLEWDVVVVPGLVEGAFPTGSNGRAPSTSGGWTTDLGALPFQLRGDADMVPQWRVAEAGSQEELAKVLEDFRWECGAYEVAEERRLAYVAVTRARRRLVLTGAVWADGKRPRTASRFLAEAGRVPGVRVRTWADDPRDGEANPRRAVSEPVAWPVDPLGERRADVEDGAELVRAALAGRRAVPPCASPTARKVTAGSPRPTGTGWAREVVLLLAERDAGRTASTEVALPVHLSASRVVELAADPARFAARLRRPMPSEPSPGARRGSAFHAWLERRFGAAALVDVDDLPGSADDAVADLELAELQGRFLASEWAGQTPDAVEVGVETPVGDVLVRCRIDAVFRRRAGSASSGGSERWDVVDWKTGAPPRDSTELAARSVQLAVYRLAWARLEGVPVDRIGAAFFYAATGETVRPIDLLGGHALELLIAGAVRPTAGAPSASGASLDPVAPVRP